MHYNFLQFVVVFVTLASILGRSSERELRPSDHGLAYQEGSSPPAQNHDGKEMRAFFGATPSVQLPEARNITDSWWSSRTHAEDGRARDFKKDHVRLGLLVASAVCGVIGVALLAISGVVFLRRLRSKSQRTSKSPPTFVASAHH